MGAHHKCCTNCIKVYDYGTDICPKCGQKLEYNVGMAYGFELAEDAIDALEGKVSELERRCQVVPKERVEAVCEQYNFTSDQARVFINDLRSAGCNIGE